MKTEQILQRINAIEEDLEAYKHCHKDYEYDLGVLETYKTVLQYLSGSLQKGEFAARLANDVSVISEELSRSKSKVLSRREVN